MPKRLRSFVASTSFLVVTLTASSYGAAAQTPPPPTTPTTRSMLDELVSSLLPTTTVAPAAPKSPAPAPPASGTAPGARTGSSPSTAVSPTTTVAPSTCPGSAAPAAGGSRPSSGPRSSAPLVDALRRVQPAGASATDSAVAGMGRFPVGGVAEYRDDWLAPRSTPCFRLHKGTDVFAARGTPVRAPAAGTLRFSEEPVGGKTAYVTEADGTYYYMAHMDSFAALPPGNRVSVGQVVGFVGDSGNASGTHVHFQVHPRGGAPVNPKPLLDVWLDEALNGVSQRTASFDVSLPRAVAAIDRLRRFEAGDGASGGQSTPLLWAAAVSSGGSSIRLAQMHVARIAAGIDWSGSSAAGQAEAEETRQAEATARALLWPLTPPEIVAVLDPGS